MLLCSSIVGQTAQAKNDACDISNNHGSPTTSVDTVALPDTSIDPDTSTDQPLPAYQLNANTWMLFGNIATLNTSNRGFNANAGFIVTDEGVVVIDALGTPLLGKRLIATIRCVTDKPIRYLIITHHHPDHAYGSAAFAKLAGTSIIAHDGTRDYLNSATLDSSVAYRRETLPQDMHGFMPPKADTYVDKPRFERKRLILGDTIIDIYNVGRHHSYGDLVVHQVDEQILWISDLAFNQRTTFMGDGHSKQILSAQDWLLQNFPDVRLMIPGHGSAQTPPFDMVSRTHDYVTRMRERMKQAVEDGTPMLDAVDDVEFEDWKHVPLYQENQRANANFVYREMEQAFFDNF